MKKTCIKFFPQSTSAEFTVSIRIMMFSILIHFYLTIQISYFNLSSLYQIETHDNIKQMLYLPSSFPYIFVSEMNKDVIFLNYIPFFHCLELDNLITIKSSKNNLN